MSTQPSTTKACIQAVVVANPGIHAAQLALVTGSAWNTCMHHVRAMERDGLLMVQKIEGKVCIFDRSQGAIQYKAAAAALQCATYRKMAAYILQHPGRTQRQLAGALDMSTTAVHRRLARLEDAGLVYRLVSGRTTLVQPSDDLADAFVTSGLRTPAQTTRKVRIQERTLEQSPASYSVPGSVPAAAAGLLRSVDQAPGTNYDATAPSDALDAIEITA